jgi:hypothetical protein
LTTVQFQLGGTLKFLVEEPAGHAMIALQYEGLTVTARGDDMAYTLPNDKMINVKVSYVDGHGNPATVDGDVSWDTSDQNIITVETDSMDSTQAKVKPAGPAGQAQVTCTADADLGEGTREIITTMDIEVVAGEAVAGTIAPVGESQPMEPSVTPHKR